SEQPARHLTEARRARQIGAIGGQIDTGQHDLAVAGRDETARLIGEETHRHRSARAAREGDDAKGAAMVAALLDLEKGAALALEAVDRPLPSLPRTRGRVMGGAREVALRPQLLLIA